MDASRDDRLRLLTFNLQVGLRTRRYADYLTGAWRHAIPGPGHGVGLLSAVERMGGFDFVAVQEADAGSLRTRFVNQIEHLAAQGGYAYHGFAVTRRLQPLAGHCMGYLSRWPARVLGDHPLPGALPGRRVLHVELELPRGPLSVLIVHLALGAQTRHRQLSHIADLAPRDRPVVIMGDFNCGGDALRAHPALRQAGFAMPDARILTFPSWAPRRDIDHILLSPGLRAHDLRALPAADSDHLPLAAEIGFDEGFDEAAAP